MSQILKYRDTNPSIHCFKTFSLPQKLLFSPEKKKEKHFPDLKAAFRAKLMTNSSSPLRCKSGSFADKFNL